MNELQKITKEQIKVYNQAIAFFIVLGVLSFIGLIYAESFFGVLLAFFWLAFDLGIIIYGRKKIRKLKIQFKNDAKFDK